MTETVETPQAAKKAPGRAPAVVLTLKSEGKADLKVGKYPMPVRAPRYKLKINGQECDAAQTEFKHLKYTYFTINGVDFWVTGHLDSDGEYTLDFPDGYEFKPLKLDRKAQSEAAKKAKAAKAAKTGEGDDADTAAASEESALGDANAGEAGEGTGEASEAPSAAPSAAPAKGKKARR